MNRVVSFILICLTLLLSIPIFTGCNETEDICNTCFGIGKIDCPDCDTVYCRASGCDWGKIYETCLKCSGSGYSGYSICWLCDGAGFSEWQNRICSSCDGMGYTKDDCSRCNHGRINVGNCDLCENGYIVNDSCVRRSHIIYFTGEAYIYCPDCSDKN